MAELEYGPPWQDYFGNWLVTGSDGEVYEADEDDFARAEVQEAAAEDAVAWRLAVDENAKLLEHRFERPLTSAERATIYRDAASSGHVEATDSYLANYPADRRADDDERQDLMREFMDDADAE